MDMKYIYLLQKKMLLQKCFFDTITLQIHWLHKIIVKKILLLTQVKYK
jgi:hypothetical protein